MIAAEIRVPNGFRLCIVAAGEINAPGGQNPPPPNVARFSITDLITSKGRITSLLEELVAVAETADATLVEWNILHAPFVSTLSRRLEHASVPLIAICSDKKEDHTAALVLGADQVLTVPFEFAQLRACILAHARSRASNESGGADGLRDENSRAPLQVPNKVTAELNRDHLRAGPLAIDTLSHQFFIEGRAVEISALQFNLISFLMKNCNRLLTKDQIREGVWGLDFDPETGVVEVAICRIRNLFHEHSLPPMIETVRGKGLRFVAPQVQAYSG